jgi:hypothetical protein
MTHELRVELCFGMPKHSLECANKRNFLPHRRVPLAPYVFEFSPPLLRALYPLTSVATVIAT